MSNVSSTLEKKVMDWLSHCRSFYKCVTVGIDWKRVFNLHGPEVPYIDILSMFPLSYSLVCVFSESFFLLIVSCPLKYVVSVNKV